MDIQLQELYRNLQVSPDEISSEIKLINALYRAGSLTDFVRHCLVKLSQQEFESVVEREILRRIGARTDNFLARVLPGTEVYLPRLQKRATTVGNFIPFPNSEVGNIRLRVDGQVQMWYCTASGLGMDRRPVIEPCESE